MTEHRVSMLRPSLRRHEDPTRSRDPQVVALLERLRTVTVAPEPRAHFRAELRAQLVAVAPRLVAEGSSDDTRAVPVVPRPKPAPHPRPAAVPAPRPVTSPTFWDRLRAVPIARPLGVAASVIVVFALLLGGAVWMSQKSLPGDSLYGLKRASERVQLSLASDDAERAQDHLDFAQRRVEEARHLLSRSTSSASGSGVLAGAGVSAHTSSLIASALHSADSDTRSASRLLGGLAVRSASGSPLSTMTSWAPRQLSRLKALSAATPAGELRAAAGNSTRLVHEAAQRATVLKSKVDCSCLGNVRSDSLGPVPCSKCASQQPGTPKTSKPTRPKSAKTSTRAQVPGGTTTNPGGGRVAVPPTKSVTTPKSGGATSAPKSPLLPLPTANLPTVKSLPPLTVGSCINLLDLLKLGKCSSKSP